MAASSIKKTKKTQYQVVYITGLYHLQNPIQSENENLLVLYYLQNPIQSENENLFNHFRIHHITNAR